MHHYKKSLGGIRMNSTETTKRTAYLTIVKSNQDIATKDIVADYDPKLALEDIESVYNSDEFISEVPEGETRYELVVDGEDIDINPYDGEVDVNMDAITQQILEKLYLCDCYADLIIWYKVGIEDRQEFDTIKSYRKYKLIDEFMSNVATQYIETTIHPSTNVLLNIPEDLNWLYDWFESIVNEIINLYELYMFNYSESIQTIIDNQLVILDDIRFSFNKERMEDNQDA